MVSEDKHETKKQQKRDCWHRNKERYLLTKADGKKYYYGRIETRAKAMLTRARARALKANLPCTITLDLILKRLKAGVCEVTGDAFDLEYRPERAGRCNPYSPSIDQVLPGKGYTPDNVQVVVWWYNRMKTDLTDSEALEVLRKTTFGKS